MKNEELEKQKGKLKRWGKLCFALSIVNLIFAILLACVGSVTGCLIHTVVSAFCFIVYKFANKVLKDIQ